MVEKRSDIISGTDDESPRQTFVLIKPDGLVRGLAGEVFRRFEQKGLTIAAVDIRQPSREVTAEHYGPEIAETHDEWVREALVEYLTSSTVMPVVFRGRNAVRTGRKIVGESFEPAACSESSIRGAFSTYDEATAAEESVPIPNLVHAADSVSAAAREISLWFPDEEFQGYDRPGVESVVRRFGDNR